ncbi:hypothetical protein D9M68_745010 [compost metagenome]
MVGQLLHGRPRQLAHRHPRQRRCGQVDQPDPRHVARQALRIVQQAQFAQGVEQAEQRRLGQPGALHQFAAAQLLHRWREAVEDRDAPRQRADKARLAIGIGRRRGQGGMCFIRHNRAFVWIFLIPASQNPDVALR